MTNEYAIVPEEEFSKLKADVLNVKNNPLGVSEEGKNMVETLKQLNQSMTGLVNLFNTATDELKMEEHDSALISEKIGPLFEKIDNLEKQNEKIAKGIVAVADMLKEFRELYEKNISIQSSKKEIDDELNYAVKQKGKEFNAPMSNNDMFPSPKPMGNQGFQGDFGMNPSPAFPNDFGMGNIGNDFMRQNNQGMGMNKPLPISDMDMPPDMGLPKKSDKKKGLFHF